MDHDHRTLLNIVVLNQTDPEVDWISFSDIIFPTYPYIGTKMIDAVMRKYIKKGAQPVQDSRTEMYAKQRDGETCLNVWQRKKINAQGLCSVERTVETIDMADDLKGSLNSEHVHQMITVDTSTITPDELEEKVLTMVSMQIKCY